MAMGAYTKEHFEGVLKKALDKAGIIYKTIKVIVSQSTQWHQDVQISVIFAADDKCKYETMHQIWFKGMPTGCGLAVMHGHYYFRNTTKMDSVVEYMLKHYENDGCTIMASIGGHNWADSPWLKRWGFICVSSYRNMAHPYANDYQSIWIRSAEPRDYNKPKQPYTGEKVKLLEDDED